MSIETGEVTEVRSNGQTATFVWKVRDFSQLGKSWYQSPSVEYFDRKWVLGMQKIGNSIDYVFLRRDPSAPGTPGPVHFGIRCKTLDGVERGAVRERKYQEHDEFCGQSILPKWTIPASAGLILTCSLRKGDSPRATGGSRETQPEGAGSRDNENALKGGSRETQPEGAGSRDNENALKAILSQSEHFGKLLLSGTGHEVLIKVGDKKFRAHKHILEARSPVFAAMFGSNMAESAGDSVAIEDCDPDSFGQFLQFVYCGRADIASVGSGLGLYHAGDKYDFPSLKKMCVEFLKSSFTTTSVFEVVSLAARHDEKELLKRAVVYLSTHLKEVMRTVEWQRFLSANPTEANEMCLKALDCQKS